MRVVSRGAIGADSNDTRQNRRLPVTGMRHQAQLHNECAKSDVAHEYSPMIGRVIERLRTGSGRTTLVDLDARIARSVALDQSEQRRPVAPSTLTAMRRDDLSICTATTARAGESATADMTIAAGHDGAAGDQAMAIVALVQACRFHATLTPLE